MRIVIALGGNALLMRGQSMEASVQAANVVEAARSIANLAREHEVVLTHGNGPQVGLLALQSAAFHDVMPYPLDVLGAESEGMIGYLLEQALQNELPERDFASLLTRVEVDPHDPAFLNPTKPVGPVYGEAKARKLAAANGWSIAADGSGYRRVVASPQPKRILEMPAIRVLVDAGLLVICVGGGGIPSRVGSTGHHEGVEAVIDKDLSAALLAESLGSELLLLLTDVNAVKVSWGTPAAKDLLSADPEELRALNLAAGSMGPKVEAASRFVEATGHRAAIGALADAAAIVAGRAGTQIGLRAVGPTTGKTSDS
jgi:carbamate kinase